MIYFHLFSYMDLQFSEIEQDNSEDRYWEQPVVAPKKKKVTFDDILSNMNLVVNPKGVLQFMQPAAAAGSTYSAAAEEPYGYGYGDGNGGNRYGYNRASSSQQSSVPPAVKHSYIYNKYFTNYQDPAMMDAVPQYRTPQTKEEYRQMLIDDLRKKIEHQRHIAAIKPTQILYTAGGSTERVRHHQVQSSTPRLQKMAFR
jgi:hypothetical protein